MMMFYAFVESFIFLFALTNVIKHFWHCCWGLGFCLSLVIVLRNANRYQLELLMYTILRNISN